MTIFFRLRFPLTTSYKKTVYGSVFQNWSYVCKARLKLFLSCARGAVAIARYYFYSGTAAVVSLLNLTKSSGGSDAIYKVAVAHLCPYYSLLWVPDI